MAQKRQAEQQPAEQDPAIIAALAAAGLGPDGQPLSADADPKPDPVDPGPLPIGDPPPDLGDWQSMDSAPTDGTTIELTDDPSRPIGRVARLITSRAMVGGRWTPVPRWVGPLSRKPVDFEPVGWRPVTFEAGA